MGPDFLNKSDEEWPEYPNYSRDLTTEDPEIKRNTVMTAEEVDTVQQGMEHFSSWFHLKAVARLNWKSLNTTENTNPG